MQQRGYEIIDHTADVGLRIWAPDFSSLLEEAAVATASLVSKSPVNPKIETTVNIEGENKEELFLHWLREVLFLLESGMLIASIHLDTMSPSTGADRYAVRAWIKGEKYDPARHDICMEIKAITRHGFRLRGRESYWEAQVLFDI